MQERPRVRAALDTVGSAALAGAAIALGGVHLNTDVAAQAMFFQTFYACLALATVLYGAARIAQIAAELRRNPDPRQLRAPASVNDSVEAIQPATKTVSELQRAA